MNPLQQLQETVKRVSEIENSKAFQQGYGAHEESKTISDNPYDSKEESSEYNDWNQGYEACKYDSSHPED